MLFKAWLLAEGAQRGLQSEQLSADLPDFRIEHPA